MKMKRCELCKSNASVYCDSDRASLCWTCDAKVHSANFLVARHSRTLLCKVCQSSTPWTASGQKLWPSTASSCGNCVTEENDVEERVGGNQKEIDSSVSDEIDDQGVPPPLSSNSSHEFLAGDGGVLRKRKRKHSCYSHEDENDSSSVNIKHRKPEQAIVDETRSYHSTVSSSVGTVDDTKKFRGMHAPILNRGKLRRPLELDLNLSAIE